MASFSTANYQLNQWEPTDQVQRTDFNADNAKLDAAFKSLSEHITQKANQSTVSKLVTAVNQKAEQSDLKSLEEAVQQISADLTKLTFGTYVGDGNEVRTISLGFQPKVVLITTEWGADTFYSNFYQYYGGLALQGHPAVTKSGNAYITIVDNGFQLHMLETIERDHVVINDASYTYHYIVLS